MLGFTITNSNRPFLDRLFEPLRSNRSTRLIYKLATWNGYIFAFYFLAKCWYSANLVNLLYAFACLCGGLSLSYIYSRWYATSGSKCFVRNQTPEDFENLPPFVIENRMFGVHVNKPMLFNADGEQFIDVYS